MAPLAWTWRDLERSKLRSNIFRRAVTSKRLQLGPWLPLKLNRKSYMFFQMAPLALAWSDLERSKSRSSIFKRAVTWKRLQIELWLPLNLNRNSYMLFQMAPLAVTGVTWRNFVLSQSDY